MLHRMSKWIQKIQANIWNCWEWDKVESAMREIRWNRSRLQSKPLARLHLRPTDIQAKCIWQRRYLWSLYSLTRSLLRDMTCTISIRTVRNAHIIHRTSPPLAWENPRLVDWKYSGNFLLLAKCAERVRILPISDKYQDCGGNLR